MKVFQKSKKNYFKKRTTLCAFTWNCKHQHRTLFFFVIELWFWFWFKRKRINWIVTIKTHQRTWGLLNFQADPSWVNIRFVFTSLIFFLRIQIQQKLLILVSVYTQNTFSWIKLCSKFAVETYFSGVEIIDAGSLHLFCIKTIEIIQCYMLKCRCSKIVQLH